MKRFELLCILLLACLLFPSVAPSAPRETTEEDIDRAIESLQAYLWRQQNTDKTWEYPHYARRHHLPSGFATAIANLALAEAGLDVKQDPKFREAVDALVKMELRYTRPIALRAMTLARIVGQAADSPYRKPLVDDLVWLAAGRKFNGAWGEQGPEKFGDNMSSQFALVALWESQRAQLPLKDALFRLAERTWIQRQQKSGGWALPGLPDMKADPTARMTAAGLTSLYVCRDVLSTGSGRYRHEKNLEEGWAFLAKNFNPDFVKNSYSAYCIQQLGMLSGRKFIGGNDWYAIAAAELAKPLPAGREPKGYWGPIVRGAFELLILARGRIPLTFNKLNYGEGTSWNYHPRDLARFTEFMTYNFERQLRWQIVDLTYNVNTLLDAPIMLVEGSDALELDEKQWNILREYTLRGGTLLFVANRNSQPFLNSVRENLQKLYAPQRQAAGQHYEVKELPADSPIYSSQRDFSRKARAFPMWGVSDGSRLIAVVSRRDICLAWQRKATTIRRDDFDMGVNFFMYATGKNNLSSRMRPVFPGSADVKPQAHATVGWLKHDGNWNTQPFGLNYVSQKLTAENRVAFRLSRGVEPKPDQLKGLDLVWMTGTDTVTLKPAEIAALRDYVQSGGTLAVNAVGGAEAFARSAQRIMDEIFEGIPGDAVSVQSGLMTGRCGDYRGPRLRRLNRTRTFTRRMPSAPQPMFVYQKDGRAMGIFMSFGVHDTLDGHTAWEAISYMPGSARNIAQNIVLYAMTSKAKK